jgi:hypothetical protein
MSHFQKGIEVGIELVIDELKDTVVNYQDHPLKSMLEEMLEFSRKQTKEREAEVEELSQKILENKKRILN